MALRWGNFIIAIGTFWKFIVCTGFSNPSSYFKSEPTEARQQQPVESYHDSKIVTPGFCLLVLWSLWLQYTVSNQYMFVVIMFPMTAKLLILKITKIYSCTKVTKLWKLISEGFFFLRVYAYSLLGIYLYLFRMSQIFMFYFT